MLAMLLDEAEEQECREILLAYFFLWRHGGTAGLSSVELDGCIDQCLDRRAHLRVDFEVGDALSKLEQLRLVEQIGQGYHALPLAQAVASLEVGWGSCLLHPLPDLGKR